MSEKKIIIRQLNSEGTRYDYILPKGWTENVLRIYSYSGDTITLAFGGVDIESHTYSTENYYDFDLSAGYGVYSIARSSGNIQAFTNTFVGLHSLIMGYKLIVTSLEGATVTVTNSSSTLSYTYQTRETSHTFLLSESGVYIITASKTGYVDNEIEINVNSYLTSATVKPSEISSILEQNSWDTIKLVSDGNKGSTYWSIGDTKSVAIKGDINGYSFDTTLYVYIIDFAHNTDIEGTGICFQGFKTADGIDVAMCADNYGSSQSSGFVMNQSSSTEGGWNGSYMKTNIIPQFKKALPADLQKVIKSTTLWTHNAEAGSSGDFESNVTSTTEDIYLLAEYEIFGSRTYANSYEKNKQTQYQYYKQGKSKKKYNNRSTSSAVVWWERSARCNSSTSYTFCNVNADGSADFNFANYSYGFAPGFKV